MAGKPPRRKKPERPADPAHGEPLRESLVGAESGAAGPARTVVADRGDAGQRLDVVLCRHLSDVSAATRTRVQRWITGGRVTVNGRAAARPSARTAFGDVVQVAIPPAFQPQPVEPEPADLRVLYEDDHLLAIDKPAGTVVHPTYRNTRGTILNALLWYARDWPAGYRPSLLGRLDKDTSGLLLVARSASVHRALQRAAEEGRAEKDYLAIVWGRLSRPVRIDQPLALDPLDRRRVVVSPSGARSVTLVEPLAATARDDALPLTLVKCRLVTGRTHQIRVHLQAAGMPIVGDPLYGSGHDADAATTAGRAVSSFSRQALHAWRLSLPHPESGAILTLEAPVPGDMRDLLDKAQVRMTAGGGRTAG